MKNGTRGHLGLDDRTVIEEGIEDGRSATSIAKDIGVSASTVTREVKANRVSKAYSPGPKKAASTLCARYDSCERVGSACRECTATTGSKRCRSCGREGRCYGSCASFLAGPRCPKVAEWPHTCTGCGSSADCGKVKIWYRAATAQEASDARKSAPRKGVCCTDREIGAMNEVVTPLVKKGQSIEAVWAEHGGEFPVSSRTYRRYMDSGITDVVALDLPRKVRRKTSKKGRGPSGGSRVDRAGRLYSDFLALPEDARLGAWEGDTVEGSRGSRQRILSLHLPRVRFQLYLLIASGDSAEVVAALDSLEELLGSPEEFCRVMGVILVDRGTEFDDWRGMERSRLVPGRRRCRVYYADPQCSYQKGSCERNHEELRRVLPKGRTDFDALTAADAALVSSHVNSYPRPSLGGARPLDLAALVLPAGLIDGTGIARVAPDDVVLRPELVPHAMVR